jgi:hypothetical protein
MADMLRDTIAAVIEITDATADKFSQLDGKLDGLAKLLECLREGNERSLARARAEAASPLDLPRLPKDLN